MRVDRFVLDCNIWISYLITGTEQNLIDIIGDNDLTVFSCTELYEEIKRVLDYAHLAKYNISIARALKLVKSITVRFELSYPIKRYILSDINDDYIVALALQTSSGFIVSGDKDFLSQKAHLEKKFRKLSILTKSAFETIFNNTEI